MDQQKSNWRWNCDRLRWVAIVIVSCYGISLTLDEITTWDGNSSQFRWYKCSINYLAGFCSSTIDLQWEGILRGEIVLPMWAQSSGWSLKSTFQLVAHLFLHNPRSAIECEHLLVPCPSRLSNVNLDELILYVASTSKILKLQHYQATFIFTDQYQALDEPDEPHSWIQISWFTREVNPKHMLWTWWNHPT